MINPSILKSLRNLKDGDVLRYRLGIHTGGYQPNWSPWVSEPFTIIKRLTSHPKATTGSFLEAGAVICITPRSHSIEFCEKSFCSCNLNVITFDAENYIIEIELP